MKAKNIATGEIKEIIFAELDENGKQIMAFGKPIPTHIDGFGFPFPHIIDSEGYILDNSAIEFIDYSLDSPTP